MLKVCRVDDRLIHGQVATSWIGNNNIEVIVIVDDEIATDAFQIQILKMAGKQCKTYVQSVDKFITKYKAGILDAYNVMLLFKNIFVIKQLIESGIEIKDLVIGNLSKTDDRIAVTRSVALNQQEANIIKEISNSNCNVVYKMLYTDQPKNMLDLIEEANL